MDTNNNQNQNFVEEQEIDIMAIVARLWEKRKFIIKVTCVFAVIGLFVAIFSPKVYTSSCTFVPQTTKKTNSSVSSLAALAGINLNNMSAGETLSPLIYPQILDNIDFKKELMYSKIKFSEYEEPISLLDYYTNPDYAQFSLIGTIKRYTIGLPGLIISAIRGVVVNDTENTTASTVPISLKRYTNDEYKCALIIKKCITMTIEEKKGYITIVAHMGEPLAAAQLCQLTFDLLEKYVTEFKISKAKNQQAFIKGRYEETKAQYEEKQRALAQFMDANKVISTAQARTEQDRLMAEYNMANAIYSEMAKQLLQAEIQVKEDTPLLTAVKPVAVPFNKSKPQRAKVLFFWCFFGGIISCGLVICGDWFKERGFEHKLLKKILD